MTELEKAERRLLEAARVKTSVSSADLIAKAERAAPGLSPDTVRLAYWSLVSDGKLERTDAGVKRRS